MKPSRIGWSVIAAAVASTAVAVFFYFLSVTDAFIEKKRPLTLMYEPHPLHRHVLLPNQHYHSSIDFSIGPHRMRGREPALRKPAGATRIFAIGGSSVFDHLSEPSWPERLGPESFNGGVPGYSSREALSFYRDRVSVYRSDVVILYFGWNDLKYMNAFAERADVDRYFEWRTKFETQYLFLTEPRPWRNFYALKRMLEERDPDLRVREAELDEPKRRELAAIDEPTRNWAQTAGMTFFRTNVEDLLDRIRRDGARPIIVIECTLASKEMSPEDRFTKIKYEWIGVGHGDLLAINEAMAALLLDVGRKEEVEVLDARPAMNGRPEYFSDHVHLTPAGSEALARSIATMSK